ncbi:putative actin-binding protein Fragmin [Aspergillus steynii IBT 23096]|uniref:Putative actin-binding protein Fragmin n=1 Tax=Aspergillus steynii IBT 23096 TaxID=1392250 RepID=A0A2I2GBY6_9EURO|nr:putative actin-binding protein Fragmin [Aspergillus steynii IBT 23096]PLB50398.1 putative actin-binding protein Fragmin [Aspergillus steynii IBT 23096]
MPPHEGLVHPKEYDIKDSNVELIGSDLDHQVKYNSAASEPAWNNGKVGQEPGLLIWRIENFEVVPWPKERTGEFYDGDSFIVLHSYKLGDDKLGHDIFFWLGSKTTQDEAGTAAYKTVELDEFLHGEATQHREVQQHPSEEFTSLFRRISIRSGGVRSGFTHVEEAPREEVTTLLRVFKHPGVGRADSLIVYEVEPTWESLDDGDVFVLDKGDKIWVWQGKSCSPMEKGKAAQVVHDLTLAKHVDVEVLSQLEARSKVIVDLLGGKEVTQLSFQCPRPFSSSTKRAPTDDAASPRKLFRLSDASGKLSFDLVKEGNQIKPSDLDGNDVFLYDVGNRLWVWQGLGASANEKALWLKVAQSYVRWLQESQGGSEAHFTPIAKVVQGHESPAFMKAIAV